MSFVTRALNVSLELGSGALTGSQNNRIDLTGFRAEAVVDNPGGQFAVGNLTLRVWGLKLSDMNDFSTNGLTPLTFRNDRVTVSAGDVGGPIKQVFDGTIFASTIDFAAQPEVSFDVQAQSGLWYKVKSSSPNSYNGQIDVSATIKSLATSIGFGFTDGGVKVQLQNQYLAGTVVDQIRTLASAAGVLCDIANGTVSIWPPSAARDATVVQIGPDAGMVGYPQFTPVGINVKVEFNPQLLFGRQVQITSSIPKAQGVWTVAGIRHELSTLQPNGSWFTTLNLARRGLVLGG